MPRDSPRLVPTFSVMDVLSTAIREAAIAGGLEEVVVARPDGMPIAHNLVDANLAKRLAAMSAAIVGTSHMATSELRRGAIKGITIESAQARMVCIQAGDEAIVTALAPVEANVGMMLLILRQLASKVAAAIERWNAEHPSNR